MGRRSENPSESLRKWISGVLVTLTTIVAYLAFWRLQPVVTFVIGCLALVLLLAAAWYYGGKTTATRSSGK